MGTKFKVGDLFRLDTESNTAHYKLIEITYDFYEFEMIKEYSTHKIGFRWRNNIEWFDRYGDDWIVKHLRRSHLPGWW